MPENFDQDIQARVSAVQKSLSQLMPADRDACGKSLKRLGRAAAKPGATARILTELTRIEARVRAVTHRREARRKNRPSVSFPENLPITGQKDQIIEALRNHQVVIVSGETGCGKSTQLPKMCLAAGRGIDGSIGCTQPRRIAAMAVAGRIAEELGEETGKSVGYRIRFTDRTGPGGYVKVMTDGILLAEAQRDPMLLQYDTLIIDEAHERSLNIDFLLGLLRNLIARRPELKVVITSATMDTGKFSEAFGGAPVISVEGRVFPVEVRYRPPGGEDRSFIDDAVDAADDLVKESRNGDLLIFMPTEADIMETCERLEGIVNSSTVLLPLFSRLSTAQQRRVFSTGPKRRIIVATNVAETSLTIPGIRYVVDTGLARIPRYVPRTRTTIMPVVPVSRSSADQRKGRCGRVQGGICVRLYGEKDYESRPLFTPPEIRRANLAEVILRMISLKLGDVDKFPFIDPPAARSISDGLDLLRELGAISGPRVILTERGRLMARMPLDPRVSRMLLEAVKEGCVRDVSIIASALSIQDPRERPAGKTAGAERRHSAFAHPESDFLTLQNIWRACERVLERQSGNRLRAFCRENHLSHARVREWRDIHGQITAIVQQVNVPPGAGPAGPKERYGAIHRSILSGYLSNIARKKDKNLYRSSRGRDVTLFPGSTLFNRGPEWIVASEIIKTSRLFARNAARIEPGWLEALGGDLCSRSYLNPHWEKNRGEVRAFEQLSLYGLVIEPGRPVSFGPIDPQTSRRIFIKALVDGEIKPKPPFLEHNLALRDQMLGLEDKLRRRDIFAGEPAMEEFYDARLPSDILDLSALAHLVKKRDGDEFLRMSEDDLTARPPERELLGRFPDTLSFSGEKLRFNYSFSPGDETDGVTLSVPWRVARDFPATDLDWAVPGLVEQKVSALLRGLPKRYRKSLVPIAATTKTVIRAIEKYSEESLVASVARALREETGVEIPASVWLEMELPEHLRIRFSVTDEKGGEIASGRDPSILSAGTEKAYGREVTLPRAIMEARQKWERAGISRWDFGGLPAAVDLGNAGFLYPALVAEQDGPALRLFTRAAEAAQAHREGVRALFCRVLRKDLRFLTRSLEFPGEKNALSRLPFDKNRLAETIHHYVVAPFACDDIRGPEAFNARLRDLRAELIDRGNRALREAGAVIAACERTLDALAAARGANSSNPAVLEMLDEIHRELVDLLPGDFLMAYDRQRVPSLPRYIEALRIRAERGSHDVEKDAGKKARVRKYINALTNERDRLAPGSSAGKRAAIDEFKWMIEEFKISLFAQEIKTSGPVSPGRLDAMLKKIIGML